MDQILEAVEIPSWSSKTLKMESGGSWYRPSNDITFM